MGKRKITAEQIAFIREHVNDMPRAHYIELSGVSPTTFYSEVRRLGGQVRPSCKQIYTDRDAIVREYFPNLSAYEIERRFHISTSAVIRRAKRMGIQSTPEKLARLREKKRAAVIEGNSRRDYSVSARKYAIIRRMEQYRIWDGKPQKTRLKFTKMPHRIYIARWRLLNWYGYEPTDHLYTLIAPVKRHSREGYYEKRYGFKFVEKEREGSDGL